MAPDTKAQRPEGVPGRLYTLHVSSGKRDGVNAALEALGRHPDYPGSLYGAGGEARHKVLGLTLPTESALESIKANAEQSRQTTTQGDDTGSPGGGTESSGTLPTLNRPLFSMRQGR